MTCPSFHSQKAQHFGEAGLSSQQGTHSLPFTALPPVSQSSLSLCLPSSLHPLIFTFVHPGLRLQASNLRFLVITAYFVEHFRGLMACNTYTDKERYSEVRVPWNQAGYALWRQELELSHGDSQRSGGKLYGAPCARNVLWVNISCTLKRKRQKRTELRKCTDMSTKAEAEEKGIQTEGWSRAGSIVWVRLKN